MANSGIGNIASFEKFVKTFNVMPEKTEEIIKQYFKTSDMTNQVTSSIKPLIPISNVVNKKYKGKVREHAKYSSNSIKTIPGKRGFLVTNEKYYQYLVFPNLGLGTSKNNPPINFVSKGIEQNTSKINSDLENLLEKELQNYIEN